MTAVVPTPAGSVPIDLDEAAVAKRRDVRARIESWDKARADRLPMGARSGTLTADPSAARLPVLVRLEDRAPEAVQTLAQLSPTDVTALGAIYLRAQKVLNGPDSRYALAMIEDGLRTVMLALSSRQIEDGLPKSAACALADVRRTTCDFVTRREGEVSRHYYARDLGRGVLLSFAALLAVGLLGLVVIRTWLWLPTPDRPWSSVGIPLGSMVALRDVLLALGGGAAGAAVSVLLRLSQESELKFETIAEGAARYRIILGWFFALALLFLVKGGIAANLIADPSSGLGGTSAGGSAWVSSWFFWAGLGLLAGFNERWVTHIIARDSKVPAPRTAEQPPPPRGG